MLIPGRISRVGDDRLCRTLGQVVDTPGRVQSLDRTKKHKKRRERMEEKVRGENEAGRRRTKRSDKKGKEEAKKRREETEKEE